jgi:hypothetical protein
MEFDREPGRSLRDGTIPTPGCQALGSGPSGAIFLRLECPTEKAGIVFRLASGNSINGRVVIDFASISTSLAIRIGAVPARVCGMSSHLISSPTSAALRERQIKTAGSDTKHQCRLCQWWRSGRPRSAIRRRCAGRSGGGGDTPAGLNPRSAATPPRTARARGQSTPRFQ